MLYRTDGGRISLVSGMSEVGLAEYPGFTALAVAANRNGRIAIVLWDDRGSGKLAIHDIGTRHPVRELPGQYYDAAWFDDDTLIVSSGTSVMLIGADGNDRREICRYGRIPYGPLAFRTGPGKDIVAFLRREGDHLKQTFVDAKTGTVRKSKHSCYSYSFDGPESTVFDHRGSIFRLDIDDDRKSALIRSTKSLIGRSRSSQAAEMERILSVAGDPRCTIDQVSHPVIVNDRLYFASFVCSETRKSVALMSVKGDLSDLRVHVRAEHGLVRGIMVDVATSFTALRLWPNALLGETIEPGWYHSSGAANGFLKDAEIVGTS